MNRESTETLEVTVPRGLRSKTYRFRDGRVRSLLYNTPVQRLAVLEDDSAEVFELIFRERGAVGGALDHIETHPSLEIGNRRSAALKTLSAFLASLVAEGFLERGQADEGNERDDLGSDVSSDDTDLARRDLEDEIALWMADEHVLYTLSLELTYRCNERCVHCYCPISPATSELTTSEISQLLTEFASLGGFHLHVTGGEALLRPDLPEILRVATALGLLVDLTNNLTLLTDDLVDLLVEIAPRSVGCSLYGPTPEVHDAVTQIAGSFAKSIHAVRQLRERGIPLVLKSPLLASTVAHWPAMEALAQGMGCEHRMDLSLTPRNDGSLDPIRHRVVDAAVAEELFATRSFKLYTRDEALTFKPGAGSEVQLCGAGAAGLHVTPDGKVRPCIGLMEELGRYPQDSLSEIWTHAPWFANWERHRLAEIPRCSSCDAVPWCMRCPGAWALETGSVTEPAEYTCFLSKCRMRAAFRGD